MIIEGEIKVPGYKTAQDIEPGECFCFLDESTLYYRAEDIYINLKNGDVFDILYENNTPVREIATKILIIT